MARTRKPGNKDLPEGLYRDSKGFRFKRVDGVFVRLGKNKKKAIAAANQYNASYRSEPDLMKTIIPAIFSTLEDYLLFYEKEHLKKKKISDSTRKDWVSRLKRLKKYGGHYTIEQTQDIKVISALLDDVAFGSPRVYNNYRGTLSQIFNHMIDEGIVEKNIAEFKMKKVEGKVKRIRLDEAGFNVVYEHSEPWLQNAMDLALQTTQSRFEVASMKFSDIENGYLHVVRKKVEETEAAFVRYPVQGELKRIIDRCRDNVASPYLVHRIPIKKTKDYMNVRDHFTQVVPDQITRAFKESLDTSKHYKKLEKGKTPPTFHEIRALAIKLFEKQGVNATPRASHNSREMTKKYLKRHGEVEFVTVPFAEIKI